MAMPETSATARLTRMALLTCLGVLAIFVEAAPLGLAAQSIPSPDLLACVVAAGVLRRPRAMPLLLVFALGLGRDLLTDLPVGAGALGLVLLAEALRARSAALSRRSILIELATVAGAVLLMLALVWLMVFLTFAQPPFVLALVRQWVLTMLAYPFVILVLRWVFGISWQTPAAAARPGARA